MEAAGKLFDHSEGRYLEYARCLVGLCFADHKKLRYPLRFEIYRKKEDCLKEGTAFHTKIELAIQMIQWAIEQDIPFRAVVFDSWFFSKELVDHIEGLGKDWISIARNNRLVVVEGKSNAHCRIREMFNVRAVFSNSRKREEVSHTHRSDMYAEFEAREKEDAAGGVIST